MNLEVKTDYDYPEAADGQAMLADAETFEPFGELFADEYVAWQFLCDGERNGHLPQYKYCVIVFVEDHWEVSEIS